MSPASFVPQAVTPLPWYTPWARTQEGELQGKGLVYYTNLLTGHSAVRPELLGPGVTLCQVLSARSPYVRVIKAVSDPYPEYTRFM